MLLADMTKMAVMRRRHRRCVDRLLPEVAPVVSSLACKPVPWWLLAWVGRPHKLPQRECRNAGKYNRVQSSVAVDPPTVRVARVTA